jgi:hypothetical protein
MSGANQDHVYRAASDAAHVELNSILHEIDQLRLRREQIQKVAESLRPLVESAQQYIPADPYAVSAPIETEHDVEPVAVSDGPFDPIKRQISFALGKAAVA